MQELQYTERIDFDTLYATYERRVYLRVASLLRYRHDLIDDVLQDTWLKASLALPKLKHQGNLYAWLYIIATNAVRDAIRKANGRLSLSLEAMAKENEWESTEIPHGYEPDLYSYIPEQLARNELRRETWEKSSEQDRHALLAYVNNESVDIELVYAARRNFKQKYERAERRERALEAAS